MQKTKKIRKRCFCYLYTRENYNQTGRNQRINMQLKIFLPKHITGSCRLLLSYSNQKLKLLNSSVISQEYNQNIEIEEIYKQNEYLPPWNLYFELLNGSFTEEIKIKKQQELGYFHLTGDGGKEITFKYEKEK